MPYSFNCEDYFKSSSISQTSRDTDIESSYVYTLLQQQL